MHEQTTAPPGARLAAPSSRPRPAFLTVEEVAGLLRVDPVTIYRAIRAGEFPAVKIRKRYVVPPGDRPAGRGRGQLGVLCGHRRVDGVVAAAGRRSTGGADVGAVTPAPAGGPCPRCGQAAWRVAARSGCVACGHEWASAPPPQESLYERWAYGDGWRDGLADGRRRGFEDGYRRGFDAGADVGSVRLLLALEAALGDRLPDLLPRLPRAWAYVSYRRLAQPTDEPCGLSCGRCARCVRATAAAANLARHGQADFPGGRR